MINTCFTQTKILLPVLLMLPILALGQDTIIKLWPHAVPNQIKTVEAEIHKYHDYLSILNVQDPAIEAYLPSKKNRNGRAVLIFPGGSYTGLAYGWEGIDVAKALNAKGISAFIVKYRLPTSKSLIDQKIAPLQDAQRAIRIVKGLADLFHINAEMIGVIGFSAGGHLASTLGTRFNEVVYESTDSFDSLSSRPSFLALIYPVISMRDSLTHQPSRQAFLRNMATDSLQIATFSNELHVNENTPPSFLLHAGDDIPVPVENSVLFYKALRKKGISAELHLYPSGGHGFGLALGDEHLYGWIDDFTKWVKHITN